MSLTAEDVSLFHELAQHADDRVRMYKAEGVTLDRALEFTLGEITDALDEREFRSPAFFRQLADLGSHLTELYRSLPAAEGAE